jgi:hypothetical protein
LAYEQQGDAVSSAVVADDSFVTMAVSSLVNRPYLLRGDGRILRPDEAGTWEPLSLEAHVNDIYLESQHALWAATDQGLYVNRDGVWTRESDLPGEHLAITHGYVFALGEDTIFRMASGGIESDRRELELPSVDAAPAQFVMLGSHSHVLRDGSDLFLTSSLGLGWTPLNAPAAIHDIAIDDDGNLLALTSSKLLGWNWSSQTWSDHAALPQGNPPDDLITFNGQTLLLVDGQLYRLAGEAWAIDIVNEGAYLTDLGFQYPDTLWALDITGNRLWHKSQTDPQWQAVEIVVDN